MPQYMYTSDEGQTIIETQSAKAPIPQQIVRDGVTFNRDIVAEHKGFSHHPGTWPQVSNSMSILKEELETELSDNQSHGLNISYKPDHTGKALQPVFESRAQRANFMARKGFYDRDAGYGDRAPEHAGTGNRQRFGR